MAKRKTRTRPLEAIKLYAATRHMSKSNRQKLGMTVPVTIYVQDPLVAMKHRKLGLKTIEVDWEPGLMDGPTSARIAVVDYDADSGVLTNAARWDEDLWCFVDAKGQAIGPENATGPQFCQVNAWAVIQNILSFYENPHVLGRAIPWAFEGNRLIVVPRAGYRMNAYYERRSKSLQFYYFGSPEEPVHTSLSHDIIAHETGHAILDGIRPYYNELSSLQTAAFHEFMADLTAILSAMRNNDVRGVVTEVIKEWDGDLSKDEVIGDLAERFGQSQALAEHGPAARPYLRTAHNPYGLSDIKKSWTAHDCSQVLTGTMFEILTKMTLHHRQQGQSVGRALWNATDRFTRIALRPLDYCPPADIQFIDYARAILLTDEQAYPQDTLGYRQIIREVFHSRGFCSKSKADHEQGSCDLNLPKQPYNVHFHRYDITRVSSSRTMAYHFLHENREILGIPSNQDFYVVDLYDTDKVVAAQRRLPREIIIEYIWREDVPLQGSRFGRLDGQTVQLLCGGTLVFDGRGNVLFFTKKPGVESARTDDDRAVGKERRERLLDYIASQVAAGRIGLAGESEVEILDAGASPIIAYPVDGALRLKMTPHLRHSNGD